MGGDGGNNSNKNEATVKARFGDTSSLRRCGCVAADKEAAV